MLLLSLDNNTIPASILGFDQVDAWTVPMAEAARDIAASEGLLSVVQEFVAS